MSFAEVLDLWPDARIAALVGRARRADVERALGREERTVEDLAALLSPPARDLLECLAVEAQRLTRRHFGRTVGLYAPIYLSNVCASDCAYCGFSAVSDSRASRRTLLPDDLTRECRALAAHGFRQVLLVTGDAPGLVTQDFLGDAVGLARRHFPSVAIEVQALDEEVYRRLCALGIEGVTLYMETYDRAIYDRVHRRGRKKDFLFRLAAVERAGRAGARRLNIGALLGLAPWRTEAFRLALHARHLQKSCWQSAVAVSFPRLRHVPAGFTIPAPVDDVDFVHLLLALRLFLPEAGFTLSTREKPEFRDRLIPLGITMMSAGSSTRPGGYAGSGAETLAQFATEDRRSPQEVAAAIRKAGYDPVWKDFDQAFDDEPDAGGI